eukprot:CAMPEP_0183560826 /NCGR_PEP_ID=MMETSP0371-20130417/95952_1 /TAXON_ID=268820 /ORGANISM="Peridinium aciculiferum, Strain PAER-2" /LENGTH=41 /DNA_ID= /DNA_START= /DNA_END= /DNA_ORIENTATION=
MSLLHAKNAKPMADLKYAKPTADLSLWVDGPGGEAHHLAGG